jgi:hypothetical protein
MNKSGKFLVLTVLLSLAACSSVVGRHLPTDTEIAATDIGPYPDNYELLVKEWFSNNLKDSDSARYGEITKPIKHGTEYLGKCAHYYATYDYVIAYLVTATVNAKNSYGGYEGWETYKFYLKNGKLREVKDLEYFCGYLEFKS